MIPTRDDTADLFRAWEASIAAGRVTVDGQPVKSEHVLRDGQLIAMALVEKPRVDLNGVICSLFQLISTWWLLQLLCLYFKFIFHRSHRLFYFNPPWTHVPPVCHALHRAHSHEVHRAVRCRENPVLDRGPIQAGISTWTGQKLAHPLSWYIRWWKRRRLVKLLQIWGEFFGPIGICHWDLQILLIFAVLNHGGFAWPSWPVTRPIFLWPSFLCLHQSWLAHFLGRNCLWWTSLAPCQYTHAEVIACGLAALMSRVDRTCHPPHPIPSCWWVNKDPCYGFSKSQTNQLDSFFVWHGSF